MITGKNYVGSTLKAGGNKTFKTFNPQQNVENPWVFTEATHEEIEEAVALAHQAFGTYKKCSGLERAGFLNAIADEIVALGNDLLVQYCSESGFPMGRAEGERGRMVGQLRAFAQMLIEGSWVQAAIDTAITDRVPAPKEDLRKILVPLGPVVVFGSSNFPFAFSTAGGDTCDCKKSFDACGNRRNGCFGYYKSSTKNKYAGGCFLQSYWWRNNSWNRIGETSIGKSSWFYRKYPCRKSLV
jgi:NADP-dependent aldehyde dehydrogenase